MTTTTIIPKPFLYKPIISSFDNVYELFTSIHSFWMFIWTCTYKFSISFLTVAHVSFLASLGFFRSTLAFVANSQTHQRLFSVILSSIRYLNLFCLIFILNFIFQGCYIWLQRLLRGPLFIKAILNFSEAFSDNFTIFSYSTTVHFNINPFRVVSPSLEFKINLGFNY